MSLAAATHSHADMPPQGIIDLLRSQGLSVSEKSLNKTEALRWAIKKRQRDAVKLLLDEGAGVTSEQGLLHLAGQYGDAKILSLLLESNLQVDLEARDEDGSTALALAAEQGRDAAVRLLIERGAQLETRNSRGQTPLSLAAEYGHKSTVQLLQRHGADIRTRDDDGSSALHHAALFGHSNAIQVLLDLGVGVDQRDSEGYTPLMVAAQRGLDHVTQFLISKGAGLEARDNSGATPLHHAASTGLGQIVQILLRAHANMEEKDNEGSTPLSTAASSGQETVVQLLLLRGAELEAKDKDGWHAIHYAASHGHNNVIDTLLAKGVAIDEETNDRYTPLLLAADSGMDETVRRLLSRGADYRAREEDGWSALHLAAAAGHESVVQTMLENGAEIDEKTNGGETALMLAARADKESIVQSLVMRGASLAAKDDDGWSVLHSAAGYGHEKIVDAILRRRKSLLEQKDNLGRTPLASAASSGRTAAVRLLLDNGARMEATCNERRTPLILAAEYGHNDTMELLLHRGADPSATSKYGWTLLHYAARFGHETTVESILGKTGIDIEEKDDEGRTAVVVAAEFGQNEVVELLVKRGADLTAKDKDGWTALHYAARFGQDKIIETLLSYRAVDVEAASDGGLTALALAATHGLESTLDILLTKGADMAAKDKDGAGLLHLASLQGHTAMVRMLVDHKGIKIDERDGQGQTCLHLAVKNGHAVMVDFVLELGADIESTDGFDQTPLHQAVTAGHEEIVELLLNRGANLHPPMGMADGEGLLHHAVRIGNGIVTQVLLQRGLDPGEKDSTGRTAIDIAVDHGMEPMAQLLKNFAERRQNPDLEDQLTSGQMSTLGYIRTVPNDYSQYAPLNPAESDIRLLVIDSFPSPSGHDAAESGTIADDEDAAAGLVCTVVKTTLLHHPSYCALSYVWGEFGDTVPITLHFHDSFSLDPSSIDEKSLSRSKNLNSKHAGTNPSFSITRNLYNALCSFRHHRGGPVFIWNDMICINQGDVTERSQQVAFMSRIYEEATNVTVWLGGDPDGESDLFDRDEDEDLEIFLQLLHRHSRLDHDTLEHLHERWEGMRMRLFNRDPFIGLDSATAAGLPTDLQFQASDSDSTVAMDLFLMYHSDPESKDWRTASWGQTTSITTSNSSRKQQQYKAIPRSTAALIRSTKSIGPVNAKAYFYNTVLNRQSVVFRLATFLSVCQDGDFSSENVAAWEGLASTLRRWHNIFFNPWFGRSWVVQEVAKSKNTVIRHCKEERGWSVATNLGLVRREVAFAWSMNGVWTSVPAIFPHMDPSLVTWYQLWNEIERLQRNECSILYILHAARDFQATDPRDRVYALVHLANDLPLGQIAADYTRDPSEVYLQFTRWLIREQQSLDILSFCGDTHSQVRAVFAPGDYTRIESLPSWSPDYRHVSVCRLGFNHQRTHYLADSGRSPAIFRLRDQVDHKSSLRLGGVKLAVVAKVFPVNPSQDWPQIWAKIRSFSSVPSAEKKAKTTDDIKSLRARHDTLERYFRTLTADVDEFDADVCETLAQSWLIHHNAPPSDCLSWNELDFLDRHLGEQFQDNRSFNFAVHTRLIDGRYVFVAHDGRIGLCPRMTQAGDMIAVLFGGATPYVLRSRQGCGRMTSEQLGRDPTYEFIGECYLDGRMFGEVLENPLFEDPLFADPLHGDAILDPSSAMPERFRRGVYRRQIFCLR